VSFHVLASLLLLWAPIAAFAGVVQPLSSLDVPLEDLGESLESCLHHVSFVLPSYFHAFVLTLIDYLISHALALLEKQRTERVVESAQIAKNAKLEVLVRSQAEKIIKHEMAYADLKCEKENATAGYQRLAAKHDTFCRESRTGKGKTCEGPRSGGC
jgi:hypothetical protein